ncbi:MAG: BMP family ABC transporter substrate-binding protein, partial [Nitrospinota bacterium]
MRRWLLTTLAAMLVAAVAVPTLGAAPEGIRLALFVTPPGKGDLSWNFMAWLGAERAKALGYVKEYVEIVSTEATALSDLTLAAESGRYDLIVSAGWEFIDPLRAVANRYPQINYVSLDNRPAFEPGDPGDQ